MSEEELLDDGGAEEDPLVEAESKGSIARGVRLVLLFHLVQIPLAVIGIYVSLALISVSQLVYVIPAIVSAGRKGHEDTVKGILIAASLTVLLNVACAGYIFFTLF